MRIIDLEKLPKYNYRGNLVTDWSNSIGVKLHFIYQDIQDEFVIVGYNKEKRTLSVNYKDGLFEIQTSNILKHAIGSLFGKCGSKLTDYKYEVEKIYHGKEIIARNRIKKKGVVSKIYTYKCIFDGYIGTQTESHIDKHKCPVCSGNVILPHINGLQVKYPDIYEMIVDENKEILAQNDKAHWRCAQCNNINFTKVVNLIHNRPSFPCIFCGDGISFPEKILYNTMRYISDSFTSQATFEWSQGRKYDVFDKDIFIEIHGLQHYERTFEICGGRTLEEEQENDRLKKELAVTNYRNIKDYIVIDARISDIEFIKENILNSNLKEYYDLSTIDWDDVYRNSLKSLVVQAAMFVNDKMSIKEISKAMKLNDSTVRRYIKRAVDLKLCSYNFRKIRQIICLNDFSIYNNSKLATNAYNIKGHSAVLDCCKNKIEYAGKHPETGEPLRWMYYDDYLEQQKI